MRFIASICDDGLLKVGDSTGSESYTKLGNGAIPSRKELFLEEAAREKCFKGFANPIPTRYKH